MKTFLLYGLTTILLLCGTEANALTSETRSMTNSDGSARYVDPDEQTPRLLAPPNINAGRNGMTSPREGVLGPNVPQMLGAGHEGEQAFDRAYSHLGNR
ncbi:MAG: hypothetical protein M3N08_01910 [Pseudomonadota bacterium]|nr:hypothetical protein [Pseudomonadota bacterium]